MSAVGTPRRMSPLRRLRRHEWSPVDRTMVIALLAIVFGCLFLVTYCAASTRPAASFALTLVGGVLLHGFATSDPEQWGILALHILAVASFTLLMAVIIGRWAIVPTWLFFVILGNTSSGGAVSPPLLPAPFAFISQWLPSGATVTALRDAVYFRGDQHVRPIAVLAVWALALFVVWLIGARRREASAAARPGSAAAV
jgi:hypothetical protein